MKPLLSVIYPYRNRDAERVERSLSSLYRMESSHRFEIILVDYGSDVHMQEKIKSLLVKFPSVTYVFNHTSGMPWSRSHALNSGIRLASSDYIFTADVDMIFDTAFSAAVQQLMLTEDAVFFSVGYLPDKFDYSKTINEKDYQKSESYALGLALIKKKSLEQIGGYDEFYCFWGMEDNDIHHRLNKAGNKCSYFESGVLLYHQWHPPANADLPEGWRTCMGEYFEAMKTEMVRNKNHEWGKIFKTEDRKAWNALTNKASKADNLSCRKGFFEWQLKTKLDEAASGQTIIGSFTDTFSEKYLTAKPGKLAAALKNVFNTLHIPINVNTAYTDQFMTPLQARDAFFYFAHFNRHVIADYAFHINEDGRLEYAFTVI